MHGTDDQQTVAFTGPGLEYLRELISEHPQHLIPAALSGWLLFNEGRAAHGFPAPPNPTYPEYACH
jgi:hypothetical protein